MSAQMNDDHSEVSPNKRFPGGGKILIALVLDTIFVLIFASSGRTQHGEVSSLMGTLHTAWPFLLAMLAAWLLSFAWQRPFAVLRSGVPIWIGTVALGMLLRVWFTEGGAPLPFVLVATGTLGVCLLGWRLIAALARVLRSRRRTA